MGQQLLDLPLAPPLRCLDQLVDVPRRQMVAQENQCRQMDVSTLDVHQQPRVTAHEPGCHDPAERRAFTHTEPPDAKGEHRRACDLQIKAPLLYFDQVEEQPPEQLPPVDADRFEPAEERFIGQSGDHHPHL
jgi:hypothetical protein